MEELKELIRYKKSIGEVKNVGCFEPTSIDDGLIIEASPLLSVDDSDRKPSFWDLKEVRFLPQLKYKLKN